MNSVLFAVFGLERKAKLYKRKPDKNQASVSKAETGRHGVQQSVTKTHLADRITGQIILIKDEAEGRAEIHMWTLWIGGWRRMERECPFLQLQSKKSDIYVDCRALESL